MFHWVLKLLIEYITWPYERRKRKRSISTSLQKQFRRITIQVGSRTRFCATLWNNKIFFLFLRFKQWANRKYHNQHLCNPWFVIIQQIQVREKQLFVSYIFHIPIVSCTVRSFDCYLFSLSFFFHLIASCRLTLQKYIGRTTATQALL